jgi:hypothetical protein
MTFTPADFWIGESGMWFFSLMWEHGTPALPLSYASGTIVAGGAREDQEPVEFLDDRGIIK